MGWVYLDLRVVFKFAQAAEHASKVVDRAPVFGDDTEAAEDVAEAVAHLDQHAKRDAPRGVPSEY